MNFYFDLFQNLEIERYSVTFGISTLSRMSSDSINEPPAIEIALPDNLIRLIEIANEGSEEHQEFLQRIVFEFSETEMEISAEDLTTQIFESYSFLQENNAIITITGDDISDFVVEQFGESFSEDRYYISMSPLKNFVKEYYLRVISWAKRTGSLIIETSSYFFRKIGHYITTLQLPDKLDDLIESKKKHIDRVFSFDGGTALKWFIAFVSGTAGFFHPLFGVPSLLITFVDP